MRLIARELCDDRTDGSYDGDVASARIAPVDGSIATTAPRTPFSPWYAARCAAGLRVSTTEPPGGAAGDLVGEPVQEQPVVGPGQDRVLGLLDARTPR